MLRSWPRPSALAQFPGPLLPSILVNALAHGDLWEPTVRITLVNHSIGPDRQPPLRACRSPPGAAEQRPCLSTKGRSALSEARGSAACLLSLEPDPYFAHQTKSELDCLLETRLKHLHPAKMVSIHSILTGAVAFLASSTTAETTAQQVVGDINQLAQKSQALHGTAQNITALNAPLIMLEQGPFRVCQSSCHIRTRDLDSLTSLRTSLVATPRSSSLARTSFRIWMGLVLLLGRTLTRSILRFTR